MAALVHATAWSQSDSPTCPAAIPAVGWLSDRETSIRSHRELSEVCLKNLVRQCEVEAEAGFLDVGSAATCSLRYEALLRLGFRGDFDAFLRWWHDAPRVASQ
jgi:hypothetical protein